MVSSWLWFDRRRRRTQRLGCDLEDLEEEGDAHRLERALLLASPLRRQADQLGTRALLVLALKTKACGEAGDERPRPRHVLDDLLELGHWRLEDLTVGRQLNTSGGLAGQWRGSGGG